MLLFDRAQRASWNEVQFPVDAIDISGELRVHVHEYPHRDGGDVEKMGRKLYVIRMRAIFDEGIRAYPHNYPNALEAIASYAERGVSANLVVPQAGSIRAMCTRWPRRWDASRRSGETMELEFLEDQEIVDLDTFSSGPSLSTIEDITSLVMRYQATLPEVPTSLWDDLMGAVNDLLALRDQADLLALQLESRVLAIQQVISQIDRAITTPIGAQCVQALVSLWAAVEDFGGIASAASMASRRRIYVTPRRMTIMQVSAAIYGTSERAMTLLQANQLDDALDIPAGTQIVYYAETG